MRTAVWALLVLGLAALTWHALRTSGGAFGYPVLLAAGALACAVIQLLTLLPRLRHASGEADGEPLAGPAFWRLAVFVAIWAAYVGLLERLGFAVATWLALWTSLIVLGRPLSVGGPVLVALFVLVLTVLLKTTLYVPVPQGWLDEQIDILLYRMR